MINLRFGISGYSEIFMNMKLFPLYDHFMNFTELQTLPHEK